ERTPAVPGAGARNTAVSASSPASSKRSPTVTMAASTVTSPRSSGSASAALDRAAKAVARAARLRSEAIMVQFSLSGSAELRGGLHHLVGARDDARVHFVGALGGDQIGHFGDGVDVGAFQISLEQAPHAVDAGHAHLGLARGGGFEEEVVAHRFQPGLVDEARHLDLAELDRLGAAIDEAFDQFVAADRDGGGVGGDDDAGLDLVAVDGHQHARR